MSGPTLKDLFCGAGGSITGMVDAGYQLVRGQQELALEEYGHVPAEQYERTRACALDVVPVLAGLANLTLYLSVDRHNAADAAQYFGDPSVRFAFCDIDYLHARALTDPGRRRPVRCPENSGRMPLMADGRGACVDCGICPTGRRDILFATSHREDITSPVRLIAKPAAPADPGVETFVCQLASCQAVFTRPARSRGKKPGYCCREHQVKAYQIRRVLEAVGA